MLQIDFGIDLIGFERQVETYLDQEWRPRAALVINVTMALIRARLSAETERVFDRPTPYTVRAFGQLDARARDADPEETAFVYPNQANWLALETVGGERRAGDFATTRRGPLIPLSGAPLNSYTNSR